MNPINPGSDNIPAILLNPINPGSDIQVDLSRRGYHIMHSFSVLVYLYPYGQKNEKIVFRAVFHVCDGILSPTSNGRANP